MRKIKLLVLLLCCLLAMSPTLSGCRRDEGSEEIDPNRTQIYAAIQDVGVGTQWLYDIKAKFEKDYPDYQLMIEVQTNMLDDGTVQGNLIGSKYDVFFTGYIEDLTTFEGKVYDLSEIVNEKVYGEDGELSETAPVKSIADKMYAKKDYYNVFDFSETGEIGEGRFIALPYFTSIYGLWYDADLFEEEGLYNIPGYKGLDNVLGTEDDFWGADGEEGTYDDGLPAVFDDFVLMIDTMVQYGITPFTWSGMYSWMRTFYLDSVWANYEGINNYMLNRTFEGTDSNLGEINHQNGWKLIQQKGRLAALKMAEKMTESPQYYSGTAFFNTQTHLKAQEDFLGSVTASDRNRIAMIIDGSWWEYEAKNYMTDMAASRGQKFAYGNRKFGFMPFPVFKGVNGLPDQTNTEQILLDRTATTCIVVNQSIANREKVKEGVAKLLQYMHTQSNLAAFHETTGMGRAYEYKLDETNFAKMTDMAVSTYRIANAPETRVAITIDSEFRISNPAMFNRWEWGCSINNTNYGEPFITFVENSNLTAEQFFAGMANYSSQSKWEELIG